MYFFCTIFDDFQNNVFITSRTNPERYLTVQEKLSGAEQDYLAQPGFNQGDLEEWLAFPAQVAHAEKIKRQEFPSKESLPFFAIRA